MTTTADDVIEGIDLTGKLALVTGASGGLGFETARALAGAGARVIMAARDPGKNARAVELIQDQLPNADLRTCQLDLSDLISVRNCASALLDTSESLDILVNNAGVMGCPLQRTAAGCEWQFGINHIGHFLLTSLLVPALDRAGRARIVVLSSLAHKYSDIDFDDPHYSRRPYDPRLAYGQSKTANALFTIALSRRLLGRVAVNSVHPGAVATELMRNMTPAELAGLSTRSAAAGIRLKTVAEGAATQVWAAVAPELEGISGRYLADCQLIEPGLDPADERSFVPHAVNTATAERLWDLSEKIVGQTFHFGQ